MPRTVLIVEDQATCACAIEIALSEAPDLETLTVSTAEEAWALLESGGQVDAVITDIHLRDMDGLELTRRIRSRRGLENMPIVVVSGCTDDETSGRAAGAGAHAFFAKPYSPALLRARMEQLLNHEFQNPE